jgi:hypothetical protein
LDFARTTKEEMEMAIKAEISFPEVPEHKDVPFIGVHKRDGHIVLFINIIGGYGVVLDPAATSYCVGEELRYLSVDEYEEFDGFVTLSNKGN